VKARQESSQAFKTSSEYGPSDDPRIRRLEARWRLGSASGFHGGWYTSFGVLGFEENITILLVMQGGFLADTRLLWMANVLDGYPAGPGGALRGRTNWMERGQRVRLLEQFGLRPP